MIISNLGTPWWATVIVQLIEHLLKDQQLFLEHFIFLKTYEWAQWAGVFVPGKHFQPCADVDKSTFMYFSFVSSLRANVIWTKVTAPGWLDAPYFFQNLGYRCWQIHFFCFACFSCFTWPLWSNVSDHFTLFGTETQFKLTFWSIIKCKCHLNKNSKLWSVICT